MQLIRDEVVILGAGPAGLLAALELVRRPQIEQVWVIDRHAGGPRHDFFPHVLLGLGLENLCRIAPGVLEALERDERAWGLPWDARHVQFHGGSQRAVGPRTATIHTVLFRRRDLQRALRERARAHPRITVCDETRLLEVGLGARGQVAWVEVAPRREPVRRIACDLLVDAMGRSSPWPKLLQRHASVQVPYERVQSRAFYACQHFMGDSPRRPYFYYRKLHARARPQGLLAHSLPDGWIVNAMGLEPDLPEPYGRPHGVPPRTNAAMLEFLRAQDRPFASELQSLTPSLERPRLWRRLSSRVNRYDAVSRALPPNSASIGDALRSLNPAYGTGLTLATLDALTLARTYDEVGTGPSFARRFHARASRESLMAIAFAYLDDLALPGTRVHRNGEPVDASALRPWLRVQPTLHTAIEALMERTTHDPECTDRVFQLLYRPLQWRSWSSLLWLKAASLANRRSAGGDRISVLRP
ncbi:MAG: hypothetical protein AAF799_32690 [Myxococcota bacterium]